MRLGGFQALLREFYALDLAYEVDDFLTTDAEFARALDSGGRELDEKLLIAETDGEAEVSLYLEPRVLERLARSDPLAKLDADNLEDFWTAFEGVSHFTYYAWNAQLEKSVTLLEMELQAEVDKYVTCLLAREPEAEVSAALRRRLFGDATYEPDLDHDERDRYRAANDNAQRYAAWLEQSFVVPRRIPEMLAELRRFYRLGLAGKLGSFARAAGRAA